MVTLSTNRLGKIYTSGSTTVFSSIDWDLRATFNGSNIFFFVILDVCVCVFPPATNIHGGTIGKIFIHESEITL